MAVLRAFGSSRKMLSRFACCAPQGTSQCRHFHKGRITHTVKSTHAFAGIRCLSAAAAQLQPLGLAKAAAALQNPSACSPEDVLTFWFGPDYMQRCNTRSYIDETFPLWINQNLFFDIAQWDARKLIGAAANQRLSADWNTPRGVLAQLVVLDQFSRCAFRGSTTAFEYDAIACKLAKKTVDEGWYESFMPVEKFWVTVALSHAENIEHNELHYNLGKSLGDSAPEDVAEFFKTLPGYPHEHYDCIKRFGRFPHRNSVLGRQSTPEELEWLSSDEAPGWARSQSKVKFQYWHGRGLGDCVRFALEFTRIPFDEVNIRTPEEFSDLKDTGKLAFGQVPLLEMDGLNLVQTQAILRYIARKKGIAGASNAEKAIADMAVNAILDARMLLITTEFQDDPKEALERFRETILPKLCGNMQKLLLRCGGPFIAGARLTYADIALYEFLIYASEALCTNLDVLLVEFPKVLDQFTAMHSFDHLRDFTTSARRKPLPDAAFVKEVANILGFPFPAYLRDSIRS